MIPFQNVSAWRKAAPWPDIDLVEQDLVLSRALIEIFRDPKIGQSLAFRGGTALNKIYFINPVRFSEDIDLVQIKPEPIGPTLDTIRQNLDYWLGQPRRVLKEGRAVLNYRYTTDEKKTSVKLKIEINTREHKSRLDLVKKEVEVSNPWFTGKATVTTYSLEELLGTKLRALYQRKKGRDLFDLWYAQNCKPDWMIVLDCFRFYLREQGVSISPAEFRQNLESKLSEKMFAIDIEAIKLPALKYEDNDAQEAALFLNNLFATTDKARS